MFVKKLSEKHPNKKLKTVRKPSWRRVVRSIDSFGTERWSLIDLFDETENSVMGIREQAGAIQVGASLEEDVFCYWNGANPSEELVEIAGDYYPKHWVTHNIETVKAIAKEFCESGHLLDSVKWIEDPSNNVDDDDDEEDEDNEEE